MAARRSKKGAAKSKKGGSERKKKEPRQKKAEVRTVDSDGIEEEKPGMSTEDGIVYTTTFLIVGALVMGVMAMNAFPA